MTNVAVVRLSEQKSPFVGSISSGVGINLVGRHPSTFADVHDRPQRMAGPVAPASVNSDSLSPRAIRLSRYVPVAALMAALMAAFHEEPRSCQNGNPLLTSSTINASLNCPTDFPPY